MMESNRLNIRNNVEQKRVSSEERREKSTHGYAYFEVPQARGHSKEGKCKLNLYRVRE